MNIRAFWRAVLNQDPEDMRAFLHEDAQVCWHCSNECFTREEFIRANCEYPGEWDGEIERIEELGDLIITAARVFEKDGAVSVHVVSFARIWEGKIISLDEYWGDDGPPPLWRQEKMIGRKIRE